MTHSPVDQFVDTECSLDDSSGLDSGPEHILLIRHIARLQEALQVFEIAASGF